MEGVAVQHSSVIWLAPGSCSKPSKARNATTSQQGPKKTPHAMIGQNFYDLGQGVRVGVMAG